MINTFSQSPPMYPSQQGSPLSIVKITLWIFTICVLGQIIVTCIFGVYFHVKLDKIEDEMELNEDYMFLRRIQKCLKRGNVDSTLLNCNEVIARLRSLISEVTQYDQPGASHDKLTDEREISAPAPRIGEEPNTPKKEPVIALHLGGKKENSNKEGLRWQGGSSLLKQNGITYTNGKFRIETPGFYYVYSQVSFCVNLTQVQNAPFVQYLYLRRMHHTDRLLIKGANTYVPSSKNCELHSNQLGAVFELNKNDLLFVNVTDPASVNYSAEFTYFGMFKLGDQP